MPLAVLVLLLHADPCFLPDEQLLIHIAARNLYEQTSGAVLVAVDFDEPTNLIRLEDWDTRLNAVDAPRMQALGFTRGSTVYLVPSRLGNDPLFVHVMMHEAMHALGMAHVADPRAILWKWASPTMRLTPADILVLPLTEHR